MRQLFAFCRPLRFIALALCSASIFVFVSPASARPYHGRATCPGLSRRPSREWHHQHQSARHRASRRDASLGCSARQHLCQRHARSDGSSVWLSNIVAEAPRSRHFRRIAAPSRLERERGVAQMQAGGLPTPTQASTERKRRSEFNPDAARRRDGARLLIRLHRTSSPRRAATSAATRPGAAACGARGS